MMMKLILLWWQPLNWEERGTTSTSWWRLVKSYLSLVKWSGSLELMFTWIWNGERWSSIMRILLPRHYQQELQHWWRYPRVANFKTRKMIGNGIWKSKLLYMISVWGGTEEYLLTALQSMQNRAAKIICNRGQRYSATQALQDVGWMDVRTL